MFLRFMVLVLGIVVGGNYSWAAAPTVNPKRTVIIQGVIGGGNVLKLTETLEKLSKDSPDEPIDMVISSPGGEVNTGFLFINVMEDLKARGTTIRCFVPTIAASMAFQILAHCNERYALERSLLLFHRAHVQIGGGLFSSGQVMTAPAAKALAEDLQIIDNTIWEELTEYLPMDVDLKRAAFESERLWVAKDLEAAAPGFIEVYRYIPGLMDVLLDPRSVKMPSLQEGRIRGIQYIFTGKSRLK